MNDTVSALVPRPTQTLRRPRTVVLGMSAVLVAVLGIATPAWADNPSTPSNATTIADLKKTQEQLSLETSVADLQLRKELAAKQGEIERLNKQVELLNRGLAVKEAERRTRLDAELAHVKERLEKLRAENELAAAELAVKARQIAINEQEAKLKTSEVQLRKVDAEAQIAKINLDLELREKRDQLNNRVLADVAYTKDPFKDGTLTVSDRRIPLNGVITMATADRITERINYFNNQNREFPIFIVIDESPGGSVAAGYKSSARCRGARPPCTWS